MIPMQSNTLQPTGHAIQISEEDRVVIERRSPREATEIAHQTIQKLTEVVQNHLEECKVNKSRLYSVLEYKHEEIRYFKFFTDLIERHSSIFKIESNLQEIVQVQESPSFQVKISSVAYDALQHYFSYNMRAEIEESRNQSCWQRYDVTSNLKKIAAGVLIMSFVGGILTLLIVTGDSEERSRCYDCLN